MGERFDPSAWLNKVFPKGIEESGLLTDGLDIKKRYLKALVRASGISGRKITAEVYKTVEFYAEKEEALKAAGERAFKAEALNGQALLTQRLKNFLVYSEVQEQKKRHKGRMYRWLPSSAAEPDPEHQLLYGKIFCEGTGDKDGYMPGERWGCQCGMEWLEDEEISPSTPQERKVLAHTPDKLARGIEEVFDSAVSKGYLNRPKNLDMGGFSKKALRLIEKKTGEKLTGFKHVLRAEDVRHGINAHGAAKELARGQIIITKDKAKLLPHIAHHFDNVILENKKGGMKRLKFTKNIGREYTYVATIGKNKKQVLFKTFYGKQ